MFRYGHCLHILLPDLIVIDIVLRNSETIASICLSRFSIDVFLATAIDMFCCVGHIIIYYLI